MGGAVVVALPRGKREGSFPLCFFQSFPSPFSAWYGWLTKSRVREKEEGKSGRGKRWKKRVRSKGRMGVDWWKITFEIRQSDVIQWGGCAG